VTDESGVLPGMSVVLKQLRTGQTFERVTNADGLYSAPLLPIGEYEITFSLAGFQTRVVRGIPLFGQRSRGGRCEAGPWRRQRGCRGDDAVPGATDRRVDHGV
jgi:hypothetical protein